MEAEDDGRAGSCGGAFVGSSNSEKSTSDVFPPGELGESGLDIGGVTIGDAVGLSRGPSIELAVGEIGTSIKSCTSSRTPFSSGSSLIMVPVSNAAILDRSDVDGAMSVRSG